MSNLIWKHSSEFLKKDILKASDRNPGRGKHYIIKLSDYSDSDFTGAMISTKQYSGVNIQMDVNHFETTDSDGNHYIIQYNNSHLVPGRFIKPESWGPFAKVGELTQEGIEFVENIVNGFPREPFDDYDMRNRQNRL